MQIPFINLADTKCWMVFLMPFDSDEREDYKIVISFQNECLKKKMFGMGWGFDELNDLFENGAIITDEKANKFTDYLRKMYHSKGWEFNENSLSAALQNYLRIKKGDYIMTRFKNSHYFIGKVSSNINFMFDINDTYLKLLSWGGYVEEWVEFENDSELPSEIVGRLSSRYNKMIEPNNWYRQNLLIMSAYEEKTKRPNGVFESIPKLKLNVSNFARSCDYRELEDLVGYFIHKKYMNDGYYLLPSTCKNSQQNYEFIYVSKGKKPITCQVKNQREIDLQQYVGETSYEKIFIFSGVWNDEYVDLLNKQYQSQNNSIYVIKPSELFEVVNETSIFNANYIDTSATKRVLGDFKLDPTNKVSRFYGISQDNYLYRRNTYKVDDDFICFIDNDFFYSFEYDALILKNHFCEDKELENKCIEYIKEYISQL